MKTTTLGVALVVCVLARFSSAVPLYEDELQAYQPYESYQPYVHYVQIRERRSPQQQNPPPQPPPQPNRGSLTVTGSHTSGSGGFVRGDYNHKIWENKHGTRLDANTYYQRNWGQPGPRQDYGGGVRLTVPIGGRRH